MMHMPSKTYIKKLDPNSGTDWIESGSISRNPKKNSQEERGVCFIVIKQ